MDRGAWRATVPGVAKSQTRLSWHATRCLFGVFLSYLFISFWKLITLQYCIGFAIHWHDSATGVHMFPILNLPPHLPPHPIPLGHPSAPAPSTLSHELNLDWRFVSHTVNTCFNAILPNHPTLGLSHRVQKTVLYICVSFAVSHTELSFPSF